MHGTTDGGLLVLPEESSRELRTLMTHGYRFVVVDPRKRIDERGADGVRRALLRRRPARRATCSASATAASRRSRAPAAGWRPRSASAATAPRSRPPACCPTRR